MGSILVIVAVVSHGRYEGCAHRCVEAESPGARDSGELYSDEASLSSRRSRSRFLLLNSRGVCPADSSWDSEMVLVVLVIILFLLLLLRDDLQTADA